MNAKSLDTKLLDHALHLMSVEENPPENLHERCVELLVSRGFLVDEHTTQPGDVPDTTGLISRLHLPQQRRAEAQALVLTAVDNQQKDSFSGSTYVFIDPHETLLSYRLISDFKHLGFLSDHDSFEGVAGDYVESTMSQNDVFERLRVLYSR